VIKTIFKNDIQEIIQNDHPDCSPKEFIKHYSAALAKVRSRLTEEQLDEVEETLVEWNDRGPGEVEQQRYLFVLLIIHVQSFLSCSYVDLQNEDWDQQ
jgi:hypothetical protein